MSVGAGEQEPLCQLPDGAACPARAGPLSLALAGPRHAWPPACRAALDGGGPTVCLPLVVDGEAVGVVSLRHESAADALPGRYFGLLSAMVQRAARLIKNAQSYQQMSTRAVAAERAHLLEAVRNAASGSTAGQRGAGSQPAAGPEAPPRLDIFCLGDFRLYRDGQLVPARAFRRRQALAVLKLLIAQPGRQVSREVLVEHLWPGADPERGAARMFGVVGALRRALEPQQRPPWLFVRTESDSYYWNPEAPYCLDVAECQDHSRRGEELERQGQGTQALALYQVAVRLYQGDFLQDEPYGEWCLAKRDSLRELYLRVVQSAGALLQAHGDLGSAIACYRRGLQVDPLREDLQRELMRCLWQVDRPAEALREYTSFSRRLKEELDVEPSPETRKLFRAITTRQSPLRG